VTTELPDDISNEEVWDNWDMVDGNIVLDSGNRNISTECEFLDEFVTMECICKSE
jgi:hypothetical protein